MAMAMAMAMLGCLVWFCRLHPPDTPHSGQRSTTQHRTGRLYLSVDLLFIESRFLKGENECPSFFHCKQLSASWKLHNNAILRILHSLYRGLIRVLFCWTPFRQNQNVPIHIRIFRNFVDSQAAKLTRLMYETIGKNGQTRSIKG